MARNGTGTMSIPNSLVAGTTITASDHNENYSDIAAELTNSVAVDGQSTMTGSLKASSGTEALPGITFGSDTDSGIYRRGSNNIGVAVAAAKVLDISTTGLDVIGTVTTNNGEAPGIIGEVKIYAGSSAPTGWLFCQGQAVSRTTYAALFAIVGTAYGVGDGSLTFNVPDLSGRVPAGKEATATRLTTAGGGVDGGTLGASGGAQNMTIAQANLPAVNFTLSATTTLSWTGGSRLPLSTSSAQLLGGTGASYFGADTNTNPVVTTTGTAASGGSGTALKVVQPTIVMNFIIKT